MKKYFSPFIIILIVLFSLELSAQNDSIGVYIPNSDSSPFDWEIKHMWVQGRNTVVPKNGASFLKIWTDNGKVVKETYHDGFDIIPNKKGEVNVYSIQRIYKAGAWDTVKTKTSFTAIIPPKVITVVDEKYLKDSLDITYSFIEKSTQKANARYQIGALPPSIKVFRGGKKVGEIEFFADREELRALLVKGNTLAFPSCVIRDMETGLLLGTQRFKYKIK